MLENTLVLVEVVVWGGIVLPLLVSLLFGIVKLIEYITFRS